MAGAGWAATVRAYFRRQHAIGGFILDFYCAEMKLAIEVDGQDHQRYRTLDAERSRWLWEEHGIRVVRFTNSQVRDDLPTVLAHINAALQGCR